MSDRAGALIDYTKEQMQSFVFKITHRTLPSHFTQTANSPLNFRNTMMLLFRMIKKSTKCTAKKGGGEAEFCEVKFTGVGLMDFFYKAQADKEFEVPSRQAFAKAKRRLTTPPLRISLISPASWI